MARKEWGPGNPLYDWQHRKANKSRKRHKSPVRHMARRRRRSYRRRLGGYFHRKKPRIPLEVVGAGIAIPFMGARDGWGSPKDNIEQGDFKGLAGNLTMGFAGINTLAQEQPNVFGILNPFDFNYARYSKMLIWAAITSKIRRRFVKTDSIPFLGRYVS